MTFRTSQPSRTLILNELSKDLEAKGQTVYKFGFGQSPFMPPLRVQNALQEAVTRVDYAPVQGIRQLREHIAQFHTQIDGIATDAEQIIVASGSKILLLNSMMAFEDAYVLLPSPSWVSYKSQAKLLGHTVEYIPTSYEQRWRVDPQQLDVQLSQLTDSEKSKIIVLNYPGNPDGLVYNEPELQALATILRKHQVWVIADEIYAILGHEAEHLSLRRYYPERTLVTTGLSKWSAAGGWRLGIQILPPDLPSEFQNALLSIASSTYSCAPTPVQIAALQAYVWDDEAREYIDFQRRILRTLGQMIYQTLADAGIRVHAPQGAFYLLVDFSPFREQLAARGIESDTALSERLLEDTGVIILPGSAFSISEDALTARIAYVDFNGTAILDWMSDQTTNAELGAFIQQRCRHMLEGIDKMVEWVQRSKS